MNIGTFLWPSLNCRYEGEWKDDKRHGFGNFFWEDGDVFKGEWSGGKRVGKGRLITSDSKVYLQEWNEKDDFDGTDKGDKSCFCPELSKLGFLSKEQGEISTINSHSNELKETLNIHENDLSPTLNPTNNYALVSSDQNCHITNFNSNAVIILENSVEASKCKSKCSFSMRDEAIESIHINACSELSSDSSMETRTVTFNEQKRKASNEYIFEEIVAIDHQSVSLRIRKKKKNQILDENHPSF